MRRARARGADVIRAALLAGLGAVALAACTRETATPRALPPLPPLETVTAVAATGSTRSWDGVVEAVQHATLTAQTGGRVTEVRADVNDRVHAGDVLLRLTAIEQSAGADTARADLRAAEAAAAEAEQNFRRHAQLAEKRYVSKAQLDQVRLARDSALAMRNAARARLAQATQQTGYTVIKAPFDGVVDRREVQVGETVAPGQPLLELHAPGALRVEVDVPQSVAAALRTAPQAEAVLGDGRRIAIAAPVLYPSADPASHSVRVRAELPTLDPPPAPGTTITLRFPNIASSASAGVGVRIPAHAVAQRGELSAAYVLSEGRLSLRQLRLGQRDGDEVEVLSGLSAGEVVVADPQAALAALVAQREAAR